jgi:divinyl protochlorophyllide a 8-vinyl-reductase
MRGSTEGLGGPHSTEGLVGPNAVIQLVAALAPLGRERLAAVFAGREDWLDRAPDAMVPEAEAAALHAALWRVLPEAEAARVTAEAGRLTADYVLANRIPRAAQTVLRLLPAGAAARLLGRAILAHGWTFLGSGTLRLRRPCAFEIDGNPLVSASGGVWHRATFERLFGALVHPAATVRLGLETDAAGPRYRFAVSWPGSGWRRAPAGPDAADGSSRGRAPYI